MPDELGAHSAFLPIATDLCAGKNSPIDGFDPPEMSAAPSGPQPPARLAGVSFHCRDIAFCASESASQHMKMQQKEITWSRFLIACRMFLLLWNSYFLGEGPWSSSTQVLDDLYSDLVTAIAGTKSAFKDFEQTRESNFDNKVRDGIQLQPSREGFRSLMSKLFARGFSAFAGNVADGMLLARDLIDSRPLRLGVTSRPVGSQWRASRDAMGHRHDPLAFVFEPHQHLRQASRP